MSIHSEPWPSDNKEVLQQIERELDAFEKFELEFRASERKERVERIKILLNKEPSPDEAPSEPAQHH